jgi:transposase-like protein
MNPQDVCCPNPDCPARAEIGQGHITIHCRKPERYRCRVCRKTFAATAGTPFYRLHKDHTLFVIVATLLAGGCPIQAIVAAYGLDERTVSDWQTRAGLQAQAVQEQLVQSAPQPLQHVQADEICVKGVGGRFWMAMAMEVKTKLWLGGVVARQRSTSLIKDVVSIVAKCWDKTSKLLVGVDGLRAYVRQFTRQFRVRVLTGKRGRPRLVVSELLLLGRVIKQRVAGYVTGVRRVAVHGTIQQLTEQVHKTETGTGVNTAYIERLNGTFRNHLGVLARRTRSGAHRKQTLTSGMNLVGCAYNFCWEHESLRQPAKEGKKKWRGQTPAMAAGITDHVWSMAELLWFRTLPLLHR